MFFCSTIPITINLERERREKLESIQPSLIATNGAFRSTIRKREQEEEEEEEYDDDNKKKKKRKET